MANNQTDTPLGQLKTFLNKLFQFESQYLDFGVYKILHYKKEEISTFINELLEKDIRDQLQSLTDNELQNTRNELADLEKDDLIKGWLEADEAEKKTLEKFGMEKIARYNELLTKTKEAKVSEETENLIYNHLSLFFSRYYDKGDFISKRRFGKNEKYVVPYNGEETHFYWANHDQYYIKSSETFQKFSFKINQQPNDLIVHFKLTEAEVEQGNVKADENKYFILAEKEPELEGNELTIFFEYRAMTDEEKKTYSGNNKQDKLDEDATEILRKELKDKTITARLWETRDEQTFLLKKLHHYTRKNKYDFFIHKNLKAFLQRELDFYIKSELLNVDDLYVSESDAHFENIRHNLKIIKVFKHIADIITDFLAQIEDFQKKLWEKKKFVLSTEWVITIDRLVEYIGEEAAKPLLEEVIRNKKQVEEWKELFGESIFKDWENISLNDLAPLRDNKQGTFNFSQSREDAKEWQKLPVDTKNFDSEFKLRLLDKLSEKIDLEEQSDGLVMHSDNFHGLGLINTTFYKKIKCIHIDPPYNTATSGFLYKNNYEHSSWLSMMDNRLNNSIDLLGEDASIQIHIDENEYERLHSILNAYNLTNTGPVIWDKRNPMNSATGIANQHEYIIWKSRQNQIFYFPSKNISSMLEKVKSLIDDEGEINVNVRKEFTSWINSNKNLSGGEKAYRYIDDEGRIYQSVSLRAPEPRTDPKFFKPLIHPVTKKPCPVPPNGFSRTPDTLESMIEKGEIIFGEDEKTQPRQKVFLKETTLRQFTSLIQDGKKGKADVKPLGFDFPYCHPTSLYYELISATGYTNNDYLLDYFGGSGTTFHTAQLMNSEDNGSRKCILIEQGEYVYSVIIPRIKKIAYSFDWKEGRPKNGSMNGLGVFFKYQRLEQYEEALENIAFTENENIRQKTMDFKDYIPKYFLEFQTRNSQTLVNTEAMQNPWDYRLKVWDGFTYDNQQPVDLVETFNYLIGLHLQKYFTKNIEGTEYRFVLGNNNAGKQIAVVWRNVKNREPADFEKDGNILKKELEPFSYDLLYINGQANLENYQPIEEVFKNKMVP